MWTLDQDAVGGRQRGDRRRGEPRRGRGGPAQDGPGQAGPAAWGGAASVDRAVDIDAAAAMEGTRAAVWARGAPTAAGWAEVESRIFGERAGGTAPAHGAAPLGGRSGWLAGAAGPEGAAEPPRPDRTSPREDHTAGRPVEAGTASAPGVEVVGVRQPLLGLVLSALLAAGMRASCYANGEAFAARPREAEGFGSAGARTVVGGRRRGGAGTVAPGRRASAWPDRLARGTRGGHAPEREESGPAFGKAGLLWSVDEPDPPPGAVLVGADGAAAWSLAAAHPALPLVTLPSGAAWLGAKLRARFRRGVVLAVGGLGGAGGSQRAALALAYAAEAEGLPVVLVDADPGSAQRWEAPPGVPGWEAARRWAADGSRAGLPELLASDGAIARLGWAPGEDPARLPAGEVATVCGALASSFAFVIVAVGALDWPLRTAPAGAGHVLVCAGEDGAWPPHRCAGATVSLAVLRGRGRSPDGPALAEHVGAAWAGSAADPGGPEPGGALQRLARRLWLPRLEAGEGPGAP